MRWTSSDLIIDEAVPCRSFAMVMARSSCPAGRARSSGHRRVPKGQQTVKIEPLHRLPRAECLDALRNHAQPDRFQCEADAEMQHREVTEARLELPVPHRRV